MSKINIDTSWQPLETVGWHLDPLYEKYQSGQVTYFLDVFVSLTLIPSAASVLL